MPCHLVMCRFRAGLATLIVLASLGAAVAQARTNMPRAERHEIRHEIDQLEDTWRQAILHRNVQAMDALLSEDYIAISADGMLESKEQTLEAMKTGALHFDSIDLSDRKVRFYGKTALVTSKAEVKGNSGAGDLVGAYRFTRVYVRDGHGEWKIVSFEASPIREPGEHK
jgi:ketosteroid isomerase-like protein